MKTPTLADHLDGDLPPPGAAMRAAFPLDPDISYLNHGGYGVTPVAVASVAQDWRRLIDANPTSFLQRENLLPLVRHSADIVAARLGGQGEDWVFTANVTDAANAILRTMRLQPGDEIVLTDHGYNAVRQTVLHVAALQQAEVRTAHLPWPDADEDATVQAIVGEITERTRLVVIDHICSPTSLVLPVTKIAAAVRKAGARLLVDGAHAPGQLRLDVPALGADWYIGNLHKWAFVPRGCGVLWSRPEVRAHLHPTTISHGYGQGYTAEFDWQGTRDLAAILTVPAAFEFIERAGGAARIDAYNRKLVDTFASCLHTALGTNQSTPRGMRGYAMTIGLSNRHAPDQALPLHRQLIDKCRVVAPIFALGGRLWLRVGAQIYLEPDDLPATVGDVLS